MTNSQHINDMYDFWIIKSLKKETYLPFDKFLDRVEKAQMRDELNKGMF